MVGERSVVISQWSLLAVAGHCTGQWLLVNGNGRWSEVSGQVLWYSVTVVGLRLMLETKGGLQASTRSPTERTVGRIDWRTNHSGHVGFIDILLLRSFLELFLRSWICARQGGCSSIRQVVGW